MTSVKGMGELGVQLVLFLLFYNKLLYNIKVWKKLVLIVYIFMVV